MTINNKNIALNGVLSAIAVLCLFFATILPTGRLIFYSLSSFLVSVIIIECSSKFGWIFYVITNFLAYILIPYKLGVIPYSLFFGIYGILKYYTEKLNNITLEIIIKYTYFNICLIISFYWLKNLVSGDSVLKGPKLSPWMIILFLEATFIIYDYVYTLFIQYYRQKIKHFLL